MANEPLHSGLYDPASVEFVTTEELNAALDNCPNRDELNEVDSRVEDVRDEIDGVGIVGKNNFGFGKGALGNADAATTYNFAFGANSLNELQGGTKNIAIGNGGQRYSQSGSLNITVGNRGFDKVIDGQRNVGIGNNAGSNMGNVSGKLAIENNNSPEPLIGGDFFERYVTIDGKRLFFHEDGSVTWGAVDALDEFEGPTSSL